MRRHQQEQILELIKTLDEAGAEIKRCFARGEHDAALQVLADSQQFAQRIGTFIEELEGEGTRTVGLLEDYCQTLYEASLAAGNANGDAVLKRLKKQRVAIENSVRTDLRPDRLEMVFFPYKSAMFDAMESIWRAAAADPCCDAYVVPIPYFDKLPGGALGQMHYEADQYPDDIPVVDWRSYNVAERRPDMIFVHAPYDNDNLVTTVHPDYYCERLKDQTDLLVYVPYFVAEDDVPKNLCVLPGTLYADRVFVQSEKVRRTYIRVFKAFEAAHNLRGRLGKPEDKFVALGSPKFDKAIHTQRNDMELPTDWARLIVRPDGGRKKVVFYNTTVSAILAGDGAYLAKVRAVLDIFKRRDDVVLWWRPHPLNEATYQAMRPRLLEAYEQTVADYRREGWGIYDDSAELNRAIAAADMYYGDSSSVTALFQSVGKPIVIQTASTLQEGELGFENLYDDGDHLWFTANSFNGLFRMDKQTLDVAYMGAFPGEDPVGYRLFSDMTELDGKLYFAPYQAGAIAVYDKETAVFSRIEFDAARLDALEAEIRPAFVPTKRFTGIVAHNGFLFLLPFTLPAIVRCAPESGAMDYCADWVQPLNTLSSDEAMYYFRRAQQVGAKLYAAAVCANAVVAFNMDNCVSEVFSLGEDLCHYRGICHDGEDFWLFSRQENVIVRWNPESGHSERLDHYPKGFRPCMLAFGDIAWAGGRVWLAPDRSNMALSIDPRAGTMATTDAFDTDPPGTPPQHLFLKADGDKLYTYSPAQNQFICYDTASGDKRTRVMTFPEAALPDLQALRRAELAKGPDQYETVLDCYHREGALLSLGVFLDSLVAEDSPLLALHERQIELFRQANTHADGTAGAAILDHCKHLLHM